MLALRTITAAAGAETLGRAHGTNDERPFIASELACHILVGQLMQRNGSSSDQRNAFSQLKPLCVALLPRAPLTPDRAPIVRAQLRDLQTAFRSVQLAGPLLDYAFFPLSQLLRINSLEVFAKHESVLEECMRAMAIVVRPWRRATPGMTADLLKQVWLVCTLVVGGPLEQPDAKGKAKAQQWSEETKLATLALLQALLAPVERAEQVTTDLSKPTSLFSPAHGAASNTASPPRAVPLSILAHTLTALLDLLRDEQNNELRELALETLHLLISHHLPRATENEPDLMVQFLPGTVSALATSLTTKSIAAHGKRPQVKASLASRALTLLGEVIERVVGDRACHDILARRRKSRAHIDRLEDLAAEVDRPGANGVEEETGLRSPAWLDAAVSQLHVAFLSFASSLREHHSFLVRIAYADLCHHCLATCSETLEERTKTMLLSDLLVLSCDEWPEVAAAAQTHLAAMLSLQAHLSRTLTTAIIALPQTILSHGEDEGRMISAINLLRGAAKAMASSTTELDIDAERWSFALLHALEFARIPVGSDTPSQGDAATVRAWIAPTRSSLFIGSDDMDVDSPSAVRSYPPLAFRRLPAVRTVLELRRMFTELARASPALVEHFLALATGGLDVKQRAAAWWLLDASLASLIPSKPVAKVTSKLRHRVRAVIKAIVELHEAGLDDEPSAAASAPSDSTSLIPVDHQRGAGELATKLDAFAPTGSTEEKARAARAERMSTSVISLCISLRTLATAAAVLGVSFRSELLSCLYPVLAQLGPTSHPLLQGHAEVALAGIADHAGYATVETLVTDNVDYIVNAVSQRLTFARLDPQAPLVLITVIRLVGEPLVPLIQDVVDDIFDALDDYHGYDSLCASLLAVLDALVNAMSADLPSVPPSDPNVTGHQLPPDPQRDLDMLERWYADRREKAAELPEDFGPIPQGGFASAALDEQEAQQQPEPDDPPATRTQAACTAMLQKALLFLTHESAFLRARVLALLASGVPVLAIDRKQDLLPIIHKAWPYVLNRLHAAEPTAVVAEAAALVEVLGRYVGEFMSRRIVDDAWPRFRRLLVAMDLRERGSALKGKTAFTAAQRLYAAIIGAMKDVARGVPLDGELVWEVAQAFRPFLVVRSPEEQELRWRAVKLYEELRQWYPETVWLALAGAAGHEGLPSFLRLDGASVADVAL